MALPSGKVLARTEWREHDRRRYLWNLGHGRFLLRVRDSLTVFSADGGLGPGDAFEGTPLLRVERHIVEVLVSSDGGLLTVETVLRAARAGEATDENGGPLIPGDPAPVQLNFYRLVRMGGSSRQTGGGVGRGDSHPRGRYAADDGSRISGRAGRRQRILDVQLSTSMPARYTNWRSGIPPALHARPSSDPVSLSPSGAGAATTGMCSPGFNIKGEEMWQQNFLDSYLSPTFAFAPAAGRFALGRTIVSSEMDADSPLAASTVTCYWSKSLRSDVCIKEKFCINRQIWRKSFIVQTSKTKLEVKVEINLFIGQKRL